MILLFGTDRPQEKDASHQATRCSSVNTDPHKPPRTIRTIQFSINRPRLLLTSIFRKRYDCITRAMYPPFPSFEKTHALCIVVAWNQFHSGATRAAWLDLFVLNSCAASSRSPSQLGHTPGGSSAGLCSRISTAAYCHSSSFILQANDTCKMHVVCVFKRCRRILFRKKIAFNTYR